MTAHPIDTEEARFGAEAHLRYGGGGDDLAENVLALLDALAATEHRATRAEAQAGIRGRAVAIYHDRARQAEAERDQAYEWADDQSYPLVMRQGEILTGVANALNGPTPPLTSWSHHDLAEKAAAMVARAEQAEARIKAVKDVLDKAEAAVNHHPAYTFSGQRMDPIVNGADIRRALGGSVIPPRAE